MSAGVEGFDENRDLCDDGNCLGVVVGGKCNVCGLAAALSLLLNLAHGQYAGLVAILFCAAAWIGIQRLGYIEFNLAGRLFRPRLGFVQVDLEQVRFVQAGLR